MKNKIMSEYQWRDSYPSESQQQTINRIMDWFYDEPETGLAWFYNLVSNAADEEGNGEDFPSFFGWLLGQGPLDFSEYDEVLSDLTPLEIFTHNERLIIKVAPGTDLSPIGKLTNLVELSVWYSKNGDYSFLAQLPRLKTLDFSHCEGGRNFDALAHTKITSIRGYPLNDLTALSAVPSLEEINFYGTGIEGNPGVVDVSPLKNLPNLKDICVFYNEFANPSVIKEFPENCTIINYRNIRKVE